MGTPEFAVASLQAICNSHHEPVAVVTAADKPAGRGKKLRSSAVKDFAVSRDIPVLQPEKLRDPDFVESLKQLNADVFVVVAFRMLPEVVWSIPKKGTFNLHGSLLPDYRGAAPINHAIMNDDKESGVTTFLIEKEIDTGNILFQEKIDIDADYDAGDLHDKLMELGASLVVKTLDAIENDEIKPTPQAELKQGDGGYRPAPKLNRDNCKIDWSQSAASVHNKVRGLSPYPGAYSFLLKQDGTKIQFKILRTKRTNTKSVVPGQIESDNKHFFQVACNDHFLEIHRLQMEGKRAMNTDEFLRGYNFEKGDFMS